MEEGDTTVSSELLALTYGAVISQIVKDYEDVTEINKQIEHRGYGIRSILIPDTILEYGWLKSIWQKHEREEFAHFESRVKTLLLRHYRCMLELKQP